MSLLKKIGIGTGIGVVVLGLGYLGYKKLRGKKEDSEECKFDKEFDKKCIPTKEQLMQLIREDEEIIKNLETLHYSEDAIAPFRKSVEERKALLKELMK
jgi:hypothetical protein